jgi:hypothetical protein
MDATGVSGVSKASKIAGYVISGLIVAFMVFDGVGKVLLIKPVIDASKELGLPENILVGLGVTLIVSAVLYAIPQTAVLGAILLTGYLGGATATHVRMGGPAFPIAFSVGFGVLVWLGLYLRDARIRALMPLRRRL